MRTYRPRRRVVRRRPAKKTKKAAVSKPLRRAIKVIARQEQETKFVADNSYTQGAGGWNSVASTVTTPTSLVTCLPGTAQGVGDAQRLGTRLTPVKLAVHWQFHFSKQNPMNACEYEVTLLVVTHKAIKSENYRNNITAGQLLKVGDLTLQDPSISPANNIAVANTLPVNTDAYTVLARRTFRMRKNYGITSNSNQSPYDGSAGTCHRETVVLRAPELKYDAETDAYPSNYNPMFIIWASQVNGDSTAADTQIECSWTKQLYFKDA